MSCLLCRPEPAESLTGPQMQQSGVSVEQSEHHFVIGIYQKKVMHPVSGAAARRSVNHGSLAADVLFCNWENNLSFALAFFVFSAHFAFLLGQIAFSGSCKYLAEIMPESLTKILYPFSGGDSRIIHPEGGALSLPGQNHGIPYAMRYNGGSGNRFPVFPLFYRHLCSFRSFAASYQRGRKPEYATMGRFSRGKQ